MECTEPLLLDLPATLSAPSPPPSRALQSRLPPSWPPRAVKDFSDKVRVSMSAVWAVYGRQAAAAAAPAAAPAEPALDREPAAAAAPAAAEAAPAGERAASAGAPGAEEEDEDEELSAEEEEEEQQQDQRPQQPGRAPGGGGGAPAPPAAPSFQLIHEEDTDLESDCEEGAGGHGSDDD